MELHPALPTPFVIGAVHFAPLPSYSESPGFKTILDWARMDLEALLQGGVHGVIFENNYDIPHRETVSDGDRFTLIELVRALRPNVPFGLSVLWNDYRTALSVCRDAGGSFVRVPVFVDDVRTSYGVFRAQPDDVVDARAEIAPNVALWCDVHVKHAELIGRRSISESAEIAERLGADALIVTGKWTADAPTGGDLQKVREASSLPVVVGSGATELNCRELLRVADGIIVGTSIKRNDGAGCTVNIRGFHERIDVKRVERLMRGISFSSSLGYSGVS